MGTHIYIKGHVVQSDSSETLDGFPLIEKAYDLGKSRSHELGQEIIENLLLDGNTVELTDEDIREFLENAELNEADALLFKNALEWVEKLTDGYRYVIVSISY